MPGSRNLHLRNKVFLSLFAVTLLLAVGIALVTRFVLVSTLYRELEQRGIAIAQNMADRCRAHVVTRNQPNLVSLAFDSALHEERRELIAYIFVTDPQEAILAHTFLHPFPGALRWANVLPTGQSHAVKLLRIGESPTLDIAVPILEGLYKIGSVHVGLNKKHIDRLIDRLRITYLGIIAAIVLIFFLISRWLSNYIARPLSELTHIAHEISRGNLDITTELGSKTRCWEALECGQETCAAFNRTDAPCWYIDDTLCFGGVPCKFPEKLKDCRDCTLFKDRGGDEIGELADAFLYMTSMLRVSQTRLVESEAKYRSLFESGPNPIFVVDADTLHILAVNPSARTTYGVTEGDLPGKSFLEIGFLAEGRARIAALTMEKLQRARLLGHRLRLFKPDGTPLFVNIHACPVIYQQGDALLLAITDITEMVEKDAQLVQASKLTSLGEMSAGMAHELNQPLNAIKMGSEYLTVLAERGGSLSEPDVRQVISEISTQVDKAAEIVDRLRAFGHKAEFKLEQVDVNGSIRDALAIIGPQLALQNIGVQSELHDDPLPILGNKNRLDQIILNLLTNARDAVTQNGPQAGDTAEPAITVRSSNQDDTVIVTVSDTGAGIPPRLQAKIFEPFFTTKEIGRGMGLGLSITYGIVKEFGGEIGMESEVDRGTTFTLRFPLNRMTYLPAPLPPGAPDGPPSVV